MSEEITLDDILWQLEKHPIDSDYVFGCEEVKIIYDSIIKLEKENEQLKTNWDKLKEWLESNWIESQDIWFVKIINKMQELEQGSDK